MGADRLGLGLATCGRRCERLVLHAQKIGERLRAGVADPTAPVRVNHRPPRYRRLARGLDVMVGPPLEKYIGAMDQGEEAEVAEMLAGWGPGWNTPQHRRQCGQLVRVRSEAIFHGADATAISNPDFDRMVNPGVERTTPHGGRGHCKLLTKLRQEGELEPGGRGTGRDLPTVPGGVIDRIAHAVAARFAKARQKQADRSERRRQKREADKRAKEAGRLSRAELDRGNAANIRAARQKRRADKKEASQQRLQAAIERGEALEADGSAPAGPDPPRSP